MTEKVLIKVLDVKDINHFIVKEVDSDGAKRFQQMDKMLQNTYNAKHVEGNGVFNEGSFVAAFISPDGGDKLWQRGVILENCHQKNFLFGVYFPDYGFNKTCHKSQLRELVQHMYPSYIPFQAFNYYLTDINHKQGVHNVDVINEIHKQLETKKFIVLAKIEHKDRTGRYGSVVIDDNTDLAAVLIDKDLVNDIHCCHRNNNRCKNFTTNYSMQKMGYSFGPKYSPKDRKTRPEILCKCYEIIKYKRKQLEIQLKQIAAQSQTTSAEERLTSSI